MKTKNLLSVSLILLTITLNAQLKVKTDGNVKIGSATGFPSGGDLEIVETNQTTEARIFVTSANISRLWTMNSLFAYGLGIDENGYGHIYGNVSGPSSLMTFVSWGYVGIGRTPSYKLDIDGDIRVNTTIYSSDARYKENISNIDGSKNNLFKLRGVTYNFKKDESKNNIQATETMNPDKKFGKIVKEDSRKHFGFIAQEVKEIFPELVYEDDEGYLGIDYVSFIPLLIEEIKTHKVTIDKMNDEITTLKQQKVFSNSSTETISNKLFQNSPNPFKNNTIITYEIQDNFNSASIMIFDLQGTLIDTYPIFESGKNEINIIGNKYKPGMYIYSLIIDDKEIDTKRMILTK